MKHLFFAIVAILLLCSGCTQTNAPVVTERSAWIPQKSGTTQDIVDVFFADASNGWAVCRFDTILRTTDAGRTWVPHYCGLPSSSGLSLASIRFTDQYNGWGVGRDGIMMRSTDGGVTWKQQQYSTAAYRTTPLTSIFFVDRDCGWFAVGANSTIFRTVDGGNTWASTRVDTSDIELRDVVFTDRQHGCAVGNIGTPVSSSPTKSGTGAIAMTWNGGSSWRITRVDSVESFSRVFFVDSANGWAAAEAGTIYATVDGGLNWFRQETGTAATVLSLFFTDKWTGWAVVDRPNVLTGTDQFHMILHTADGGGHWAQQKQSVTLANLTILLDVFFVDRNNGWAVGTNGTIWRTSSGGL